MYSAGIRRAFSTFKHLEQLHVFEDDTLVSSDIFCLFSAARAAAAVEQDSHSPVAITSAYGPAKHRSSLIWGHLDESIGPIVWGSSPHRLVLQPFTPRAVFMTLAWSLSRQAHEILSHCIDVSAAVATTFCLLHSHRGCHLFFSNATTACPMHMITSSRLAFGQLERTGTAQTFLALHNALGEE